MNDAVKVAAAGAFVYAAVYLGGCVVVGLMLGNAYAWKLALLSAGAAYIAQLCEAMRHAGMVGLRSVYFLMAASILSGAAAGLSLLVG